MLVYRGSTLWSHRQILIIYGTVNPIVNIKPLKTVSNFPSQCPGVLCRPEMAHRHRILLYRFSLGPAVFDYLLYLFIYIIACRIPPRWHGLHLTYRSFCLFLWHDLTSATKTLALSGECWDKLWMRWVGVGVGGSGCFLFLRAVIIFATRSD